MDIVGGVHFSTSHNVLKLREFMNYIGLVFLGGTIYGASKHIPSPQSTPGPLSYVISR